jgi:hypothetical protein
MEEKIKPEARTLGKYVLPEIGVVYTRESLKNYVKDTFGNFYAMNKEGSILVKNCNSENELEKEIINYMSSKANAIMIAQKEVKEKGLKNYLFPNQTLQNKNAEGGN